MKALPTSLVRPQSRNTHASDPVLLTLDVLNPKSVASTQRRGLLLYLSA